LSGYSAFDYFFGTVSIGFLPPAPTNDPFLLDARIDVGGDVIFLYDGADDLQAGPLIFNGLIAGDDFIMS
jgi:hypothetical protein